MKNNTKCGFTLAELMIVVVIVGILVAISVPIFNVKMEKAREAHDIATMRTAASAAIDLYYAGLNESNASDYGLKVWSAANPKNSNIAGAYNPKTGMFVEDKSFIDAYGKGTKVDAETTFTMGNNNGAYVSTEDYTRAVVMVAIYYNASPVRAEVYWKNNSGNNNYVGGQRAQNVPKNSIIINIE